MAEPILLYGLGATKAGTSWLHRYLASHPECAMPPNKELHFFDRFEGGRLDREVKIVRARRARLALALADARPGQRAGIEAQIKALDRWIKVLRKGDARAYRDFLFRGAEGKRVVGDITPAYALLSPETLAAMQHIAADTRFVYILRDPVDRLWSHLRMIAGRAGAKGEALEPAALAAFDTWAAGGHPEVTARGDYAAILPKIATAVRPGALFLAFYETLFSDEGVGRLCAFLGIARRSGDYARRVHESAPADLTIERAARARALLAPQYEAVAALLGDVPERWSQGLRGAA